MIIYWVFYAASSMHDTEMLLGISHDRSVYSSFWRILHLLKWNGVNGWSRVNVSEEKGQYLNFDI